MMLEQKEDSRYDSRHGGGGMKRGFSIDDESAMVAIEKAVSIVVKGLAEKIDSAGEELHDMAYDTMVEGLEPIVAISIAIQSMTRGADLRPEERIWCISLYTMKKGVFLTCSCSSGLGGNLHRVKEGLRTAEFQKTCVTAYHTLIQRIISDEY